MVALKVLGVLFLCFYFVQIGLVIAFLLAEDFFNTRKEVLINLIPFYILIAGIIIKWKKLK